MPRLSFSPQRPQLPRLPHLPGTVQGAGSFASLSSCGYCGACWAVATPSDQKHTPTVRPPKPTSRDFRHCMACLLATRLHHGASHGVQSLGMAVGSHLDAVLGPPPLSLGPECRRPPFASFDDADTAPIGQRCQGS